MLTVNTHCSSVHHCHQSTPGPHHNVGMSKYTVHFCMSTHDMLNLQKQLNYEWHIISTGISKFGRLLTGMDYAVAGEQYKLVNIILTHPEVNIDEQATVRMLMLSSSTVKVVIFLCSCVVLNWHIQPVFNHFTLRTALTPVWNYLRPLHLQWHHNLQTNSYSHNLLYMTSVYEPIIASNSLWLWLFLK